MRRLFTLLVAIAVIVIASAQLETLPGWADRLPWNFHRTFLQVEVWQWIGLGVVFVLSLLAGLIARSISKRLTKFRDRFAPQPMSESSRDSIGRGAAVCAGGLMALTLLGDLALPKKFESHLHLLCLSIALVGAVMLVYGYWDAICDTLAARSVGHERAERLLIPMTRKFVRAVIVIAGILTMLGLFGGTQAIASLVATLGISGLVIALAAKDSVENLFGSLTILFDMPFALGDWVKIDKVEGSVEEINLRSTRIRTFDDTLITLPNANLIRASVENFGARRFRKQKLSLRLGYDCEPAQIEEFCKGLRAYLKSKSYVPSKSATVVLNDPQETSIGVLVQCNFDVKTIDEELLRRHELLEEALRLREPSGVVFAAPPRPEAPKPDHLPEPGSG